MKIIAILGIKLPGLREILEARVGIELNRFVDSADVVDFIGVGVHRHISQIRQKRLTW